MRDHFQRDARFQDILDVTFTSYSGTIEIAVTVHEWDGTNPREVPCAAFNAYSGSDGFLPGAQEQLFIDHFEPVPREHVFIFHADLNLKPPKELFFMMPNIVSFAFGGMELYKGFLLPRGQVVPHTLITQIGSPLYLSLLRSPIPGRTTGSGVPGNWGPPPGLVHAEHPPPSQSPLLAMTRWLYGSRQRRHTAWRVQELDSDAVRRSRKLMEIRWNLAGYDFVIREALPFPQWRLEATIAATASFSFHVVDVVEGF